MYAKELIVCIFSLMETYDMRTMFTLNMEGLQLRLYQFTALLSKILPKLSEHLSELSVHPPMYASQWFLTLFAYSFPISLVMRIYDIIFAEGAAETIMRIAIAMLKKSESEILAMQEFEEVLDFLTSKLHEPYQNNSTKVISDAMALSDVITRIELDLLSEQYISEVEEEKKRSQEVMAVRLNFWKRGSSPSNDETKKKNRESGKWLWDSSGPAKDKKNTSDEEKETKKSARKRESIGSLIRGGGGSTSSLTSPQLPPAASCDSFISQSAKADVLLHRQIEDLVSALSQLQKDNMQLSQEKLELKLLNSDITNERDMVRRKLMHLAKKEVVEEPSAIESFDRPASRQDDSTSINSDSSHEGASTATSFSESTRQTLASSAPDFEDTRVPRDLDAETRLLVFKLQQKYERVSEELVDLKSQHEMAKDAQLALVDKLLAMKDEHERIEGARIQAEKEKATMAREYENLRILMSERQKGYLEKERERKAPTKQHLENEQDNSRRRAGVGESSPSTSPLNRRHTMHTYKAHGDDDAERCSELESMLVEAKLRIVELETAASHKPATVLPKKVTSRPLNGRQSLDTHSGSSYTTIEVPILTRASTDVFPTRAPLPKRASLYGKMWSVLGSQNSS